MEGSPESTPDFKRGRYLGLIVFVVAMVVGVATVLALSGVFAKKPRGRSEVVAEENANNKEGGCPCNCDRSEAMAAELRARGGDDALSAIDKSLNTIAEREAAGYMTEAMISHRLRLLDLESEMVRAGTVPLAPRSRFVPATGSELRKRFPAVEDATLRARMELIVHGQTTEWVNDHQKPLRACFVLSIEIENLRNEERALRKPSIEASLSFPISRWYVRGGNGEPWDGRLQPGEKTSVYVIGYLGNAVSPKTRVEADIHFESLTLHTSTRALGRWNQPHESNSAAL